MPLFGAFPSSPCAAASLGTSNYKEATVFRDKNSNGVLDPAEKRVTTQSDGRFRIPKGKGTLVLQHGTNIITGEDNTFFFTAPSTSKGIGFVSTLWQSMLRQGLKVKKIQELSSFAYDDLGNPVRVSKRPSLANYVLGNATKLTSKQQKLRTLDVLLENIAETLKAAVSAKQGPTSSDQGELESKILAALTDQYVSAASDLFQEWLSNEVYASDYTSLVEKLGSPVSETEAISLGSFITALNSAARRLPETQQDLRLKRQQATTALISGNYQVLRDIRLAQFQELWLGGEGAESDDDIRGFSPLSADGRYVVFKDGDKSRHGDEEVGYRLFPPFHLFDNTTQSTRPLSADIPLSNDSSQLLFEMAGFPIGASISADGRFIAEVVLGDYSEGSGFTFNVVRLNTEVLTRENVVAGLRGSNSNYPDYLVISSDGQSIYYQHPEQPDCISRWEQASGTSTQLVCSGEDASGVRFDRSRLPSVSSDGRFIAFSDTDNYDGGGANVFLKDLSNGSVRLLSRTLAGNPNESYTVTAPAISADGRYVVFASDSPEFAVVQTTRSWQVYRVDTQTNDLSIVSVDNQGNPADIDGAYTSIREPTGDPSISGDGRYVVFQSMASHLAKGDTNKKMDIFLRDMTLQKTFLLSRSYTGGSAGSHVNPFCNVRDCVGSQELGISFSPHISEDGRSVVFKTTATNLVSGAGGSTKPITYLITNGWW
jgi:Tol biopolymer transport system component